MDQERMERVLRNLDHRVERIDQILPTLATKADLQAAIDKAVKPLATKTELRAAIDKAVEPLATKPQLRETNAEPQTHTDEVCAHIDAAGESLRDELRQVAAVPETA